MKRYEFFGALILAIYHIINMLLSSNPKIGYVAAFLLSVSQLKKEVALQAFKTSIVLSV